MLSQVVSHSTNLKPHTNGNHTISSPIHQQIPNTNMNNQYDKIRSRYFKSIGVKSTDESEDTTQYRRKRSATAPASQLTPPASPNLERFELPSKEEVKKVKNPKRVTIIAPNSSSPLKEHKDGYYFPFAMSVPASQSALLSATFTEGTSILDQRSPSPMIFDEDEDDSSEEEAETIQFTTSEAIPIGFPGSAEREDQIIGRTRLGPAIITTKGLDFGENQKRKNEKIRTKMSGVVW